MFSTVSNKIKFRNLKNIEYHCKQVLELIKINHTNDNSNYSLARIERSINHILEQIDGGENIISNVNIMDLTRHFVDDTGNYSDPILIELEHVHHKIEKINK
ncbi:hypothetical protein [Enterococcus sp. AZ126]|uniref:hypothetical protein n=1 Tax=Enterococcus sp. AZ126 TaxID=2774635 RepID=UPI003F26A323